MSTGPGVETLGVSKTFRADRALNDVTLSIPAGSWTAIVGPSGCGKTTLLRVIAGLELPDAGEVRIDGATVTSGRILRVAPHRRGLGFVFQDLALWPHMTIADSLRFVLRSAKFSRAEWAKRSREVLASTRLDGLGHRYPHELSGGEQQRAALARALIGQPRRLLLDEPLSALDAELRADLRQVLVALRSARLTMIHVTHNLEDAQALADQIVEMRHGQVVAVTS